MALEILDSRYGEAKKTLHDLILLILAKEYPLTIGEICSRLRKEFKVTLTFQAVRKSLNTLAERKVLETEGKAYALSKSFILEQKRLSDQFLKNYFGGEKDKKSLPTANKQESHSTYHFENLVKADQFWSEVVLDWAYNLKEGDERGFFFHGPHCWYIFGHLGLESTFLLELKSRGIKSFYLVEQGTLLDLWAGRFYEEHGVTYGINPTPAGMKTALGVFGDFIIQYDYPEELSDNIERFYREAKSLQTTDLTAIAKLLKLKTDINLTVMRNKAIASKLKEEILSKFRKRKGK